MGKTIVLLGSIVVIGMVLLAGWVACSPKPVFRMPGSGQEEAVYRGKPASIWFDQLQAREPAFRHPAGS